MRVSQPSDIFNLNIITRHLSGFKPPQAAFEPRGDWSLAYDVHSLTGYWPPAGKLQIHRKSVNGDTFDLGVNYTKILQDGYRHIVIGRIRCRGDELASPLEWTFDCSTVAADGTLVPNTALKQSAVRKNVHIEFTDGKGFVHSVDIRSPFTISWALLEAVQRLPRRQFEPLRFTLLDQFDLPKPNQTVSYRTTELVVLGNKETRLHAYDHLGEGIVPWVYWVSDAGRLLFAISGIEAYVLNSQETS
jgi:hypothetical protein